MHRNVTSSASVRVGVSAVALILLAVVVVLVALCALSFRSHGAHRSGNVPIAVVAGLAATGAVLALSSYWDCAAEFAQRYVECS